MRATQVCAQKRLIRGDRNMNVKLAGIPVAAMCCVASCASGTLEALSDTVPADAVVDASAPPPGSAVASASPVPTSIEVSGSYTLDVACADVLGLCLIESKADKSVLFAIPPNMKKSAIQYSISPHGISAGGTVDWASDDALDGTVRMHGYAGAFSSVHIEVSGVTAVSR